MTTSKQVGLLRFITAGSVDDGKSTLIGRLLYDSKAVLSDQLDALNRAKNKRMAGEDIDLSLLTDGLEAEREQGITIDVAYRYFATAKRKFIIADTPGHEQYTRNMVTGASTANAAIVLVDASKITIENNQAQLLTQTKRHSAVLKLLNTEHIIVAINKMDLLEYDEQLFKQIQTAYSELAVTLGIKQVHYVPISALRGDNIVHASDAMPWYQGPTLLSLLETLPVSETVAEESFTLAFPVQWVARYDGASADHFRGYAGRIEAGSVTVGQLVRTLPAGKEAQVVEILTPNGDVSEAHAGDNVCLRLNHDVDVSRGDMLVDAQSVRQGSKSIQADLCWFDDEPLNPARKYVLQHTTQRVFARVKTVHRVLDIHTLSQSTQRSEIVLNDLANLELSLQKPIMADLYDNNLALGSFILIDETTNHTVAAGMIRALA